MSDGVMPAAPELVEDEPAGRVVADHAHERGAQPQAGASAGRDRGGPAHRERPRIRELFRLPIRELAGRAVKHDVGVGVADHQQIEAGGHARRPVAAARATRRRSGDFIAATRG